MSRLQVGGLALIVGYEYNTMNLGKVVRLHKHVGAIHGMSPYGVSSTDNAWLVYSDDLVDFNGKKIRKILVESKHLMPLGDKQTQDELAKEKELEYT